MAWWRGLGLSRQFLVLVVSLLVAMFAAETLIENRIVFRNQILASAQVGSIYMRGIVKPHLEPLMHGRALTAQDIDDINKAVTSSGLRETMHEVKIWSLDAQVLYSTDPDLIGKRFNSNSVRRAATGEVVVNYGEHDSEEEDSSSHIDPNDVIEVYIPLRSDTGRIFAIGEFYQDYKAAYTLAVRTAHGNWVIRIAFLSAALGGVYLLVNKAEKTIRAQRRAIGRHLVEAKRLATENGRLRDDAETARKTAALENEKLLSRVGADIHDGPIQLLSLLALQQGNGGPEQNDRSLEILRDAIAELRSVSSGLILPDISELSADEAISLAIARHELATGTKVERHIDTLPAGLSQDIKTTLYRIVQEALNNAMRHADGMEQQVTVSRDRHNIHVVVEDRGPGPSDTADPNSGGLGLMGIANRVAAYRGSFSLKPRDGGGARLGIKLPIEIAAKGGAEGDRG